MTKADIRKLMLASKAIQLMAPNATEYEKPTGDDYTRYYDPIDWKDLPVAKVNGPNAALVGETEDAIIIAFRGTMSNGDDVYGVTATVSDFLVDLNVPLMIAPDGIPGRIHYGFLTATQSIYEDVYAAVEKIGKNKPIWVTGHSKGGAMAVIFSQLWKNNNTLLQDIDCVWVFGAPMCGDKEFVSSLGENIYVICAAFDPVPFLPPSCLVDAIKSFYRTDDESWGDVQKNYFDYEAYPKYYRIKNSLLRWRASDYYDFGYGIDARMAAGEIGLYFVDFWVKQMIDKNYEFPHLITYKSPYYKANYEKFEKQLSFSHLKTTLSDADFNMGVDAMWSYRPSMWDSTYTYISRGDSFVRYSGTYATKVDDGYPKKFKDGPWGDDLPVEFAGGFDSVAVIGKKVYFTKGCFFTSWEFDGDNKKPCDVNLISKNWGGLPLDFLLGFDSMAVIDNKLYITKGAQFVRYSDPTKLDKVDEGYPKPLQGNWGNLDANFAMGFDAMSVLPNGRLYVFRDSEYLCYKDPSKLTEILETYPWSIERNWGFEKMNPNEDMPEESYVAEGGINPEPSEATSPTS